MNLEQAAIGVDDVGPVEGHRWQIDPQGFDQLAHGPWRSSAGDGEVAQAVVGAHQGAVNIGKQKPDEGARRFTHPMLCHSRPSRASNSSAASGPFSPALY